MSHVLLLRVSAPMQSWGVASRFSRRETGREPSKSGVIGLLCAALGLPRGESSVEYPLFADLIKLKMGVRVNREGILESDYHTAQNIIKADGGFKETELSTRFYLADADFLVGLESANQEFLETLQTALRNPKWQIFLGRKAFAPALPVYYDKLQIGVESLETVLRNFDLDSISDERVRLVLERDETDGAAGGETRQDVPLSFSARRFTNRRVTTKFCFLSLGENNAKSLF